MKKSNPVIFMTISVIFRTNPVIFRTNPLIFRTIALTLQTTWVRNFGLKPKKTDRNKTKLREMERNRQKQTEL